MSQDDQTAAVDTAERAPAADRLFPSMAAEPEIADGTTDDVSSDDSRPVRRDADRARALYDGGAAPEDYGTHIAQLLDTPERDARYEGDEEGAEQVAETRRTLNAGLKTLRVGAADARDVFLDARAYAEHPKSAEAVDHMGASALSALRREYGARTDQVIEAASKVVDALEARLPGVKDFLDASGMGNDLNTIQAAIRVARRNGWLR